MSMPTRPRFTPANRPSRLGETKGCLFRFALIAAILFFPAKFLYDAANTPKHVPANGRAATQPPSQAGHVSPSANTQPGGAEQSQELALATNEQPQNIELATAGGIQRQQLAAGKFKQRQVIAAYDEVKRTLDEWEAKLSTWEKEGPSLLKSEDGKRIAAAETLTRRFRVVLGEERPSREQLSAARTAASDLIAPVRESESNPNDAALPNEGIVKALQEVRGQARKARDELRNATEQVQAILAQAGPTAGPKTLQEAIAAQTREDADARTTLIVAEVKKAEDEGNKRVADEKAKAALVEKHRQAESIRADSERQTLTAKAESERKTQAAKMAILRQKTRSPEVSHYLQPFITNGRTQPASGGFRGYGQNIKVVEEGPVSFGRLRAMGALDRTMSGLEHLVAAATNQNDRPTWTIPNAQFSHDWSKETQTFLQKAQDLLIELGPALVEEKMLAP